MAVSSVQLDLMEFVEQNILPRYNQFDRAHNMAHVMRVIKRALVLAQKIGADVNMAYVLLPTTIWALKVRGQYTTSPVERY